MPVIKRAASSKKAGTGDKSPHKPPPAPPRQGANVDVPVAVVGLLNAVTELVKTVDTAIKEGER